MDDIDYFVNKLKEGMAKGGIPMKYLNHLDMKQINSIKYDKPFEEIKSVLLFFHGKYPHISTPTKDVTFPQRIFTNAKFYIRCNTRDESTRLYFAEQYKKYQFELVDENLMMQSYLNLECDAVFAKQERFGYFGGVIDKFCVDYNIMLNTFKNKIFILFNDEFLRPFDSLDNEYSNRPETWFIRNKEKLNKIPKRTFDYSNTYVLANDNRICNWVEEQNLISQYAIDNNINLIYLTDKVLYDLPHIDEILDNRIKKSENKLILHGVYVSLFFDKRISTWNKIMKGNPLNLWVAGPGTDKLNHYAPTEVRKIPNDRISYIYKNGDWSLYMGKGTKSLYLGATFFVPLMNGCPLFIWRGTDPSHKLFDGLHCYYDTSEDLEILIKKYESGEYNIEELYEQQIKRIFK